MAKTFLHPKGMPSSKVARDELPWGTSRRFSSSQRDANHPAQGCEGRATLGPSNVVFTILKGLNLNGFYGQRFAPCVRAQPLPAERINANTFPHPKGMQISQPKVARDELPWEKSIIFTNPERIESEMLPVQTKAMFICFTRLAGRSGIWCFITYSQTYRSSYSIA